MRKLFILLMITLFAAAAASGATYNIRIGILDSGGASGVSSSSSYHLLGKARERQVDTTFNGSYKILEGFLKAINIRPPILGPEVHSIDPSSGNNSGTVDVTISGINFASDTGLAVKLSLSGTDINATNVTWVNSGKITCTFDLTGAALGRWDVTVTNHDGRSGTLPSAFTITSNAPVITSITPNKGNNTGPVAITNLAGNYFKAGAQVTLEMSGQSNIIANNVSVESDSKITCSFDLTGKTTGLWDVVVTNPDGQSGTLPQAFKIEEPSLKVIGHVINYPNPFNPPGQTTLIKYTLSKDAYITIYIYNTNGERIWQYSASPGSQGGQAGPNEVVWNGITAFRGVVGSGVYLLHVTARVNGQNVILGKGKIAVMK